MSTLVADVECYRNFFLVNFHRVEDGKRLSMELSTRKQLDRRRLATIMRQNKIVTFNGQTYDVPMIYAAIGGATESMLKDMSDRIIRENIRWWDVQKALGVDIPAELDHVDLFDPNPSVGQGLKTLNGRLHGKKMQDLPIEPSAILSFEQMDLLTEYCWNDIDATCLLLDALKEPLELREALGKQYGMDLRSKSDAQMGEAIFKKRIQLRTGQRVKRTDGQSSSAFGYVPPKWMKFETPQLQELMRVIVATEFRVGRNGKTELPKSLEGYKIKIGSSTYTIGIGGLHSTEKHRALVADAVRVLIDADVASQYPRIIASLGLYPKSIGPVFITEYDGMIDERIEAKRLKIKVTAEGLKIALNGGVYGKLGSPFSVLFAPHMLIATTLTGQLSLLMLVELAEARGIAVVSGNTDGLVFHCPREFSGPIEKDRLTSGVLKDVIEGWERDTGYEMETVEYSAIYNENVNSYIAIKEDGKVKRKGDLSDPWGDGDLREMMKKNPQFTVCSNAVVAFLTKGISIEDSIMDCTDIKQFVRVVKVGGGAIWHGDVIAARKKTKKNVEVEAFDPSTAEYLGKVVRYYWGHDGAPIYYKVPHHSTGNFKKVSKSDGARPLMELPDEKPDDIDYNAYIAEAYDILRVIGYRHSLNTLTGTSKQLLLLACS